MDSELAVERYHALSDATMDTLWESLEELLDDEGNPNYEVEYSVRCDSGPHKSSHRLTTHSPEWGADAQAGRAWDVCYQQAAPEQTNLALVTNIVSKTTSVALIPQMSLTFHSGPKRYDYSEEKDDWLYSRDGVALSDLLDSEVGQIVGRKVGLGLQNVSERAN